MKNFIDTVQSVILDIRYENNILELLIDETIESIEDLEVPEDYEEAPARDIYGNIIGRDPILYGPWNTLSNVRNI